MIIMCTLFHTVYINTIFVLFANNIIRHFFQVGSNHICSSCKSNRKYVWIELTLIINIMKCVELIGLKKKERKKVKFGRWVHASHWWTVDPTTLKSYILEVSQRYILEWKVKWYIALNKRYVRLSYIYDILTMEPFIYFHKWKQMIKLRPNLFTLNEDIKDKARWIGMLRGYKIQFR